MSIAPGDIGRTATELWFRESVRKGKRRAPVRRIIRMPLSGVHPLTLELLDMFDLLQEAEGDPARKHYFALPGEDASGWTATRGDAWVQELLNAAGIAAPPSFKYTSHSLRSGAATAMHSIGVHLTKICHYGGWAATSTAVHDYIDVAFPPSAAASRFFGWMLRTG